MYFSIQWTRWKNGFEEKNSKNKRVRENFSLGMGSQWFSVSD